MNFDVKLVYRFQIVLNMSNIEVWIQIGDLRKKDLLFRVQDSDIQRGK